jgi:hypothetical protein
MTIGAGWLVLGGSYLITTLVEADGRWPLAVAYLVLGVTWVIIALLSRLKGRGRRDPARASSQD